MTAPRVCPMCMYCNAQAVVRLCGLTHAPIPEDNTCDSWQIGYAGKQYEADQAQQERIERERRLAEDPVQLGLFEDK